MNESKERKQPIMGGKFIYDIWKLMQLTVALGSLYTLVMHVIHKSYLLFSGAAQDMTTSQIASSNPVAAPGISIGLPGPLAEIIITCIVLGTITYIILEWLCESVWVQELKKVEECWEEIKWYNPWTWVKALVCVLVWALVWVVKQICKWTEVLTIFLVLFCTVIGIILIAA